jgi:hypothetical protein
VAGRTLYCHAFIFIGDLHVVDVYVGSPDVDTVEPALVSTSDNGVVNLTVGASIQG